MKNIAMKILSILLFSILIFNYIGNSVVFAVLENPNYRFDPNDPSTWIVYNNGGSSTGDSTTENNSNSENGTQNPSIGPINGSSLGNPGGSVVIGRTSNYRY